jgi:hypothetical protein
MADFKLDPNYNDVASRLRDLKDKHPDASVQPLDPARPFWIENVVDADMGVHVFLVYAAACYRTPDDIRPGVGIAWEPFPGRTPYTRDSEVMVAETSAWGRAIVAALAADTKKGSASSDEIAARQPEGVALAQSREALQEAISGLSDADKELVKLECRNQKVPSLKKPGATREQLDSLVEFIAGLKERAEPFDNSQVTAPRAPVEEPERPMFAPVVAGSDSGTARKAINSSMAADK